MGRGRPKKSESLKDLHGTSRKDRKQKQTFTASDGKFGIPRGLNQEVRAKVRKVAHYLQKHGTPIDLIRPTFERYCKHLQIASDASDEVKKMGVTLDGKKNPAAQIWKDNSASALQIEQYFDKLIRGSVPDPEEKDPLKEFQAKGKKLETVK
jgi:phage terminase small subunit